MELPKSKLAKLTTYLEIEQIYIASKRLNLNNPILSDRRERSVGSMNPLISRVSKTRHII